MAVSRQFLSKKVRRDSPEGRVLTPAQQNLVDLFIAERGPSNRELAKSLGITKWTVGSHFFSVYDKLGVNTREELAIKVMSERPTPHEESLRSRIAELEAQLAKQIAELNTQVAKRKADLEAQRAEAAMRERNLSDRLRMANDKVKFMGRCVGRIGKIVGDPPRRNLKRK